MGREAYRSFDNGCGTFGINYESIATESSHNSIPMVPAERVDSHLHGRPKATINNGTEFKSSGRSRTGEAFGGDLQYDGQPTEYWNEPSAEQVEEESMQHPQQLLVDSGAWNPVCLHRYFLFGQAAMFASALVTTALLYYYSQQKHGLVSQVEKNHYWWKYGPTALLTVMTFVWKYIDLIVKSLVPWHEMRQGPTAADRSLLLDYLSPFIATSLCRAAKNKHWAIVLTITGYLLLLLTTAFSTSLLQLEPTKVTEETPLEITYFNGDAYAIEKVDSNAAYLFYGTHFENLSYPAGTTADTVVPTFKLNNKTHIPSDAKTTAEVAGVEIDIECESYMFKNNETVSQVSRPWISINGAFFVTNATSPDCNISGIIVGQGMDHMYERIPGSYQNYQAWVNDYVCNLGWSYIWADETDHPPPDEIDSPTAEHRLILTIADVRHDHDHPEYPTVWLNNFTMLICKPSYRLNTYLASYEEDFRGQDIKRKAETTATIPAFYNRDLIRATLKSINSLLVIDNEDPDYLWTTQTPIFLKLAELDTKASNLQSLLNSGLLITSITNVFKGTATQIIGQALLSPQNTTVNSGQAVFLEDRLVVKAQSAGVMSGAFAVLMVFSITLSFCRPCDVTPWKPGSIETIEKTLISSPHLSTILSGLGSARLSQIRRHLRQYTFISSHVREVGGSRNTTTIKPMLRHELTVSAAPARSTVPLKWWRPVGSRGWFVGLCIAIPLFLIGLLEGIQHLSNKNDGFLAVTSQNSEVFAYYIPAGLSLIISGMYGSLAWAASVFSPYASLIDGMALASRSIVPNYLGQIGPAAWLSAIKNRHFGLSVILVAQMVSSFLTIAISGLYSFIQVPTTTPITLQPSVFNVTSLDNITSDVQAGITNNLVTFHGLQYPKWTYDTLVLPSFSPLGDMDQTPGTISLNTSALRPALDCTTVAAPSLEMIIETLTPTGSGLGEINNKSDPVRTTGIVPGTVLLRVLTSIPWALCDRQPPRNQSSVSWSQHFYVRNDSITSRFGKATPLDWSTANSSLLVTGDGVRLDSGHANGVSWSVNPYIKGAVSSESNPWGCPSIAFTMGTGKAKPEYKKQNVTTWRMEDSDIGVILCKQQVTQVQTTVLFRHPGLDIESPPIVDETSAVLVENNVLGGTTFDSVDGNMWISLRLAGDHFVFDGTTSADDFYDSSKYWGLYEDIDDFIWALVQGKDGVPFEQLAGENNTSNLQHAAQRLSGRHRALSWTRHARNSYLETQGSGDVTNTTSGEKLGEGLGRGVDPFSPPYQVSISRTGKDGQRRIKQNVAPKIALQVMLGIMVLCVIAMAFLLRFAETLPHNPCSIAGTATLLVDGRDTVVDGVHDYSDGEERPLASDPLPRSQNKHGYEYRDLAPDDGLAGEYVDLYTMEFWDNQLGSKLFGIRRLRVEVEYLPVRRYRPSVET